MVKTSGFCSQGSAKTRNCNGMTSEIIIDGRETEYFLNVLIEISLFVIIFKVDFRGNELQNLIRSNLKFIQYGERKS